ncbi:MULTISPECIES: hypothetical protein [unclassified Mesorhizobium]|uniref:hypothetical protein n=1 Tax=unclassified Mesorhizobium TaxID=325217 RepID=UPI000AF43699|nr:MULTISPECIES: hypothetical protein [unclassified Mesorhizobium]MDR7031723.1 hypothetical protein [Mesorhizobium sp. BE184]
MGRILSFTPRNAASGQTSQTLGPAAAIIIFPGVRYEKRLDDERDGNVAAGQAGQSKSEPRH